MVRSFLVLRVLVAPWSVLPAPVWALVASPALRWALGSGPWFVWPVGAARVPWRASFWCVSLPDFARYASWARLDPFFPCSWPVAVVWVLRHWAFCRALDADGAL